MEYKGYLSRVEFDDEAGIFHGEVVNIRDVITFQGVATKFDYTRTNENQTSLVCQTSEVSTVYIRESVAGLREAFEDSVEDYLAFCVERGEAPDEPFSGRFTVRLSPEAHRQVILAAEKSGKDFESWVTEALTHAAGF